MVSTNIQNTVPGLVALIVLLVVCVIHSKDLRAVLDAIVKLARRLTSWQLTLLLMAVLALMLAIGRELLLLGDRML